LTDDPAVALDAVGPYLASRPVRANLVLTLLSDRVARPAPGRYGWATAAGEVEGVVFQSPVTFQAALAPTTAAAAAALAGAVADAWPDLPGVAGEAAPAAAFAGTFGAARRMPVHPVEAQRLHHLTTLRAPDPVPGAPRLAVPGDQAVVAGFVAGFHADVGEGHRVAADDEETAAAAIAGGRLWLWDDGGPRAMVAITLPRAGVARLGAVYTPPRHRRRGFAGAVTADAVGRVLAEGATPVLYTQLSNPTSNALYQRLGFEPVAEAVRYTFG
jgi:predicted GNAT family acetyltransferase